jgi:hypothetical protein
MIINGRLEYNKTTMEGFELGEEEIADALLSGVNISELTNAMALGSLLDDKEGIRELLQDKPCPMSKPEVLSLLLELKSEGLLDEDSISPPLEDRPYDHDDLTTLLYSLLLNMANKQLGNPS